MGIAALRGRSAEALAVAFLELRGLAVLERNIRLAGVEVDAVAAEGATRVLIEVKCRNRTDYGGAAAAVDGRKRQRLLRAASALLAAGRAPVRIDVVTIELHAEGAELRHYRGAVEG